MRKARLLVLLAIALLSAVVAPIDTAQANGRALGQGYFFNRPLTTGFNVIEGGIPSSVNNKEKFINFIEGRWNASTLNGPCPGNGCDYTGSAYIIQTMRGPDAAGNWDQGFPSASDIADWKAKIRNPSIGMRFGQEGAIAGGLTTERYLNVQRDVAKTYGVTSGDTMSFYNVDSGKVYYLLRMSCANPLGNLEGLPDISANWRVNGQSYVKKSTDAARTQGTISAAPGQQVQWFHDLRNNGPQNMDRTVAYQVNKTGFSNGWNGIIAPNGNAKGANGALFVTQYAPSAPNTVYNVTQDDVGNTLCQSIAWRDASSSQLGVTASSNAACVSVPYSYTLTPSATPSSDGVVESGTTVNVSLNIQNSGPTKSRPAQWQLTKIVVRPNGAVPNSSGGTSSSAPCGTYFRSGQASCNVEKTGNTTFNANGSVLTGDALSQQQVTIDNAAPGSKICIVLSVQPYNAASNDWRHSAPVCLTIGKKPKVQVLGGDLSVGRVFPGAPAISGSNVTTSFVMRDGLTYGSWSEYGIVATGSISGMASGSAYANGLATATNCSISSLSFTSGGTDGCTATTSIGKYNTAKTLPDVGASFPVTSSTASLGNNATVNLTPLSTGLNTATGTLHISGGQINKGKWHVINAPNADIVIDGNIDYNPGTMQSITDIPQVVLIGKNIIIGSGVTNIDAWLITRGSGTDGRINTCGAGTVSESTVLTATICNSVLTVNGPVMATNLFLRRTAGSDPGGAGNPAEVFNLRSDAYLWALSRAQVTARAQTVYSQELPPRF